MPDVWMRLPFISLPGEDICGRYGLSGGYCAYTDLFADDGSYKLQKDLERIYRKKVPERSLLDKDVLKLDERINLFHQLLNRQLLSIFPLDNSQSNNGMLRATIYHYLLVRTPCLSVKFSIGIWMKSGNLY